MEHGASVRHRSRGRGDPDADAAAAEFVGSRSGRVLDSRSLLKEDALDWIFKDDHQQVVFGAQRLRTINEAQVSGLAQPSLVGARGVLNRLGAYRGGSTDVLWLNLREEPLVFVNGRGLVLRDVSEPFCQFSSFKGISTRRLETLEWRIKEDLVCESTANNGNILVHSESKKTLTYGWEAAPHDAIATSKEIFNALRAEGYRVEYVRVPLTSGKAPTASFFDDVLTSLLGGGADAAHVVINCHTGATRTTLGLVAVSIVQLWRGRVGGAASASRVTLEDDADVEDDVHTTDHVSKQLLAGWTSAVLSLIRLIPKRGRLAKENVDFFIDRCSDFINLRTSIFTYRHAASLSRSGETRQTQLDAAAASLIRYMYLIVFEAYLADIVEPTLHDITEQPPNFMRTTKSSRSFLEGDSDDEVFSRISFNSWMSDRAEICNLFAHVIEHKREALDAVDFTALSKFSFKGSSNNVRGLDMDVEMIHDVLAARRGAMLNTDTILKADVVAPEESSRPRKLFRSASVPLRGAPNFRRIANSPVFGVGSSSIDGLRAVLRFLRAAFSATQVVWVNLREEPVVYIRDRPFVLRSVSRPFRNIRGFCDIEPWRLEESEDTLVRDVLSEAFNNNGKVLVHEENEEMALQMHWEGPVDVDDAEEIRSPKAVLSEIMREEGISESVYLRVPMTAEEVLKPADVHDILANVKALAPQHIVFACQMGRARSTIATVLACLALDDITDAPSQATSEYAPILALVAVMSHGVASKNWLDHIISKCDEIQNLREDIEHHYEAALSSRSEDERRDEETKGRLALKRYFELVCAAGYVYERKKANFNDPLSDYEAFRSERPEISTLYELCDREDSLTPSSLGAVLAPPPEADDQAIAAAPAVRRLPTPFATTADDQNASFVAHREGKVLVKGSILKSDHFPGCDRLPAQASTHPHIEGSPNFRSVYRPSQDWEQLRALRVYGTAIPTEAGAREALGAIASRGEDAKNDVLWIFMREEPILYVNGNPYCLRKLESPFKNLSHTGISRERVEAMEKRMKNDVIEELSRNRGGTLLHEEDENGIVAAWTDVVDVQTPRELFERLQSELVVDSLVYERVPVTDEQAPKIIDFDEILAAVSAAPATAHVILNCQMGRGRTTTGTVIACAVRLWQRAELEEFEIPVDSARVFRARARAPDFAPSSEEEALALRGEFKSILSLTRLLSKGIRAKRVADDLIDVCDAMQNLREAIFDVKLRAETSSLSPLARADEMGRLAQYTRRYYQICAFVAFLFGKARNLEESRFSSTRDTFAHWLRKRSEILRLMRESSSEVTPTGGAA